ncbi:UNVERIFIED_CONTAM: hypothetical protein GTU68_001411, partial [Idotea baltica]|nr:hypothetical protein [Idotea baltica]
ETAIEGVFVLEPVVHGDNRGYFLESYNKSTHEDLDLQYDFTQDNESFSSRGVLRGLHYQTGDNSQAKLLRVIKGEVKDIVVDIRQDSPFYGETVSVILSEENKRQLLIPRGFAHGFVVLSETALFSYKCDNFYNRESEGTINPLCPKLNLDWGIEGALIKLSEKDKMAPNFGSHLKSDVKFKSNSIDKKD